MVEGYGMTETSCVITNMDEHDLLSGHVGAPNPACGKHTSYHFRYMYVSLNIKVAEFFFSCRNKTCGCSRNELYI